MLWATYSTNGRIKIKKGEGDAAAVFSDLEVPGQIKYLELCIHYGCKSESKNIVATSKDARIRFKLRLVIQHFLGKFLDRPSVTADVRFRPYGLMEH